MTPPTKFLVFDVESVGLHGEGYAVGYVLLDLDGNKLETDLFACSWNAAAGSPEGFEWLQKNAPSLRGTHDAPWQVRAAFWKRWRELSSPGDCLMLADVPWPVEARFLAQCIDDHPVGRCWGGPYPLLDIASLLFMVGRDPLAKSARNPDELPEHDPLCDALQSARLFKEHALEKFRV